jgi:uncharacterized protein YbcI
VIGQEGNPMEAYLLTAAERVAEAAFAAEQLRTGHDPESVRVVLGADPVVITIYGALAPAERTLGEDPEGAARVRDFHRQLFATSCADLRQQIERIVGVPVREASAEVPTLSDATLSVFTTGTVVQVFLLAGPVPSALNSAGERFGHASGRPSLVEPDRRARRDGDSTTQLF